MNSILHQRSLVLNIYYVSEVVEIWNCSSNSELKSKQNSFMTFSHEHGSLNWTPSQAKAKHRRSNRLISMARIIMIVVFTNNHSEHFQVCSLHWILFTSNHWKYRTILFTLSHSDEMRQSNIIVTAALILFCWRKIRFAWSYDKNYECVCVCVEWQEDRPSLIVLPKAIHRIIMMIMIMWWVMKWCSDSFI